MVGRSAILPVARSSDGGVPLLAVTSREAKRALFITDGGPLGATARSRIFGAALSAAWPDTSIGAPHKLPRSDLYALAEGMPESVAQHRLGAALNVISSSPPTNPCRIPVGLFVGLADLGYE